MSPQRRPGGPSWPTSPEWKVDVLDRMDRLGISRAELAKRVQTSGETMSQLFGPKSARARLLAGEQAGSQESRLVPQINAVVGLPAPTMRAAIFDGKLAELTGLWEALPEEDRDVLIAIARRLAQRDNSD